MPADETIENRTLETADRLAPARVLSLAQVGGGRNSRVFRVETAAGTFALKHYPSAEEDRRDRLGVEAAALTWMQDRGVETIPRVIAVDRARNAALLSWVEGTPLHDVSESDVDQAAAFLARLHELSGDGGIPAQQRDPQACLSGAEIERQLRERAARLLAIEAEPELGEFLTAAFLPAMEACLCDARAATEAAGHAFGADLAAGKRSLVASDFGFHNALKDDRGRLTFIDFEYFGWDDPAKLVADLFLHPGTAVEPRLRLRLRQATASSYSTDPEFPARLAALLPLFRLRWVLILLNEFHPERWRKRVLAGAADDWLEARRRQLAAARRMLDGLTE